MRSFTLNGKKISFEELKNISIDEAKSEFEKSTLAFCKAWLDRQPEFLIHTSGSTGAPKEIILLRSAMEASALQTIKALKLISNSTALVCLDTKYIAGQMMLARGLFLSMDIIAIEPSANPLDQINDHPVGFMALVPYQLEAILNHSPKKLDRIDCAIIGGAKVSNSLKEKIKNSKCAIYATYGMTETISHIALQKLNGANVQDYFEALENIHLRLDERGCLCIKADYLMNEIITNDLVELIDGKKFKWLGRVDNVINSGGVKIIPEKIEAVLEKILDTLQITNRFFVVGLPDDKLGQQLTAVVEGNPLDQTIIKKILSEASDHLTKYELPKEFKFVTKFKETSTGKINRDLSLSR
jgi:O-succinylbenzoic acid--CoA ligase